MEARSSHLAGPRCSTCGTNVLDQCENSASPILGPLTSPEERILGLFPHGYTPPNFCYKCGAPHPCATWEARVWELENLLDEEELEEPKRLLVRQELKALREMADPLDEEEQERLWGRIKQLSPGFMESSRAIAVSLITQAVQNKLGLS